MLTYVRHSLPVSSEGSLACHTCCEMYNGHLRGPVILTPIAERLAVELSLPVFTTWICRDWDSNIQPSACEANAITHCASAAVFSNILLDRTCYFLLSHLHVPVHVTCNYTIFTYPDTFLQWFWNLCSIFCLEDYKRVITKIVTNISQKYW